MSARSASLHLDGKEGRFEEGEAEGPDSASAKDPPWFGRPQRGLPGWPSERREAPSAGRLRVAFFTDTFVPTHDGVAKATESLASALVRLGHYVTVFTVRSSGLPRAEVRPDGLRIRRFASLPTPDYPQYRVALSPWTLLLLPGPRFDVAHLHTPGFVGLTGLLWARRRRIPTVGTYHTNLTGMLREAGSTPFSRAFFRAWSAFSIDLCLRCDLATAPTEVALGALVGGQHLRPPRAPRVVPNGVDPSRFRPAAPGPDWHARLGVGESPIVTFLGRLTRDKGVGRFLVALVRLVRGRPWVAVIGGEGPERSAVEERLRAAPDLRDRVRLLGPVREDEKPALLAQTRVFVLPSLSDTSSVALLEAWASGVPSVVTSRGGPGEIARSSSVGLLVDPGNSEATASAVDRILGDPQLSRSLSEAGRAWVVRHASVDRMAEEFVSGYHEVIRSQERSDSSRPGSGSTHPQAPDFDVQPNATAQRGARGSASDRGGRTGRTAFSESGRERERPEGGPP